MTRPASRVSAVGALAVLAATACATASAPATGLSPATRTQAASGRPASNAADVAFMSGMIVHHAQAVLIAGWAPAHGASPAVRALCERIVVGQRDEMAVMQRWLRERQQPVPAADPHGPMMPGMDHSMLMPGMLTQEQLTQLDGARGPDFDRLFLTLMIQHHRGALTMVRDLVDKPGAAREGLLFQVASDVSADQTGEIDRMTRMLDGLSHTPQRSPQ